MHPVAIIAFVAFAAIAGCFVGLRLAARRLRRLTSELYPQVSWRRSTTLASSLDNLRVAAGQGDTQLHDTQANTDRLRLALDSFPFGFVVFRGPFRDLQNHSAETLLAEPLRGPVVREVVARLRGVASSTMRPAIEEIEFNTPQRLVVSITASPVDRRDTVAVVIEDVTGRNRLENVRRDFVANISHELQTPIGALALLAETIAGENEPAIIEPLALRLTEQAHRVSHIIGDLLELSRLEAGQVIERRAVTVARLFDQASERVQPLATERNVQLVVDDPGSLSVSVDERQLVTAVAHLVDNAVRYSPVGGVVRLSAIGSEQLVELVVKDTGMGIPSYALERVFERFYRVDQARHRETGGTGLGLAIVRHVAINHGGSVNVVSVEGEGSEFRVELPL